MILFETIRWRNFLSTGNYFTEINLNKAANTLVIGTNGAGKSTMLDALCFGLFGKPFRKINKPQLLNTINQRDCLVEIEFKLNHKQYKIIRGIKPNVFEIYQDDVLLNQNAANRDYQDFLERFILKLNFKSFTQIVILGSASFTPFMQLTAADRRSIIEDLLDIQIFSTMNSILKTKVVDNKDMTEQSKLLIESCTDKINMQKKFIESMNQNEKDLIVSYEKEIANNNVEIEKINASISKTTQNIEELLGRITDKETVKDKSKKLAQFEASIESNLSKHKKTLEFFQNNDNCPTCRQSIESLFKSEQIDIQGSKILECETALEDIEKKITAVNTRINEIDNLVKSINDLQSKVTSFNTSITEINKFNTKLNEKIDVLKKASKVNTKEEIKLEELKNEQKELEDKLKTLIEQKNYLDVASVLLKDSGIKTKIVRQYLPIINKYVNKYLASMDFFVNFNLDESFKETIKSRHRDEFSYESFSEGEKQRIDMSLMLTWRAIAKLKNSTNTNLLILDEVFDSSLDNSGTEELMKILHMLNDVNLFVISHKGDILQDKFSNVIRFEKVQNFSRMVK
jgi:DNA repair exonuclease SbcCD ATPase subunit